ncbi:hypothetical protein HN51_035731 [Arachis hypogaea]
MIEAHYSILYIFKQTDPDKLERLLLLLLLLLRQLEHHVLCAPHTCKWNTHLQFQNTILPGGSYHKSQQFSLSIQGMAGVVGKLEAEIEVKSKIDKFWSAIRNFATIFPKASPSQYKSI